MQRLGGLSPAAELQQDMFLVGSEKRFVFRRNHLADVGGEPAELGDGGGEIARCADQQGEQRRDGVGFVEEGVTDSWHLVACGSVQLGFGCAIGTDYIILC